MKSIYRSSLFAAVLLGLGFCSHAWSQTPEQKASRSHNLSSFSFPGGSEADLLKRLNRGQLLDLIKNSDQFPKQFLDLLNRNPALLDEALRKMEAGEVPQHILEPENRQRLMEQAEEWRKRQSIIPNINRPDFPPVDIPPRPPQRDPEPEPQPERLRNQPPPEHLPRPQFQQPPQNPPEAAGGDKGVSKQVQSFAEKLAQWDPSLKDSRALQNLVRSFTRTGASSDIKWGKLTEASDRLQKSMAGWERSLNLDRLARRTGISNWKLPDMPSVNLPRSSRSFSGPSMPRFSGDMPSADGGGWKAILIPALLVLGAFGFWKLYRDRARGTSGFSRSRDRLGAWPVNPAEIRTRGDLVKAFEYLALKSLGFDAETWNHRAIAEGLGGETSEVQHAATQLAGHYEYARYAPPQEELPPAALVDACRQLCFLAGVATA